MDDLSLTDTLLARSSDISLDETLLGTSPTSDTVLEQHTQLDPEGMSAAALAAAAAPMRRSTILPHAEVLDGEAAALVTRDRDRYESQRELGAGAAGQVVLVRDNDIERDVAMKRLRHGSPAAVARFVEEIRTVGSLEHPNIVPIHDVGQEPDGAYYFIMKYVEGETLEHIIERLAAGDADAHARYPFDARARIFLEILRAMQFAHARGIVHRDLKPANIMVGPYGEVMVMDWGLARRLGDAAELHAPVSAPDDPSPDAEAMTSSERRRLFATRHGTLLGTPAYMSPEQAEGRNADVDERSDIYALGVIFHEFLTLRHYLTERATLPSMLLGVVNDPLPGASMVDNPHQERVPVELTHFCRHATSKDPAQRYPTVAAMAADLELRMAGHFDAECALTFSKRFYTGAVHAFNRSPFLVLGASAFLALLFVASLAFSVYTLAAS